MSSKQRVGSAGLGGRVTVPCSSPVYDDSDTLASLRQQLLDSKAETQKVTDQLNCLILLIKRAWSGDKAASIHVGNIVGVQDPNLERSNMRVTFTAKAKCSKAVNNWGLLTAGLLNREYEREEKAVAARQKAYLNERQDYLEEQLIHHRDLRAREPLGLKRSQSVGEIKRVKSAGPERKERVPSAGINRSRAPVKPLLQVPRDTVLQSDLTLHDLVIEPSSAENNKILNGLYRLSSLGNGDFHGVHDDPDLYQVDHERAYISYDDPRRYSFGNPYNVNQMIGDRSKSRPASGILQKKSDSVRCRPKSAVLFPKGERPLRYETTRPISAAVKSKPSQKDKMQDKSSKNNSSQNDKKPPIRVKVSKPDCVIDYEDDVKKMNDLEDDFKKTALMLQKKLGINDAGTVY